MLRLPSESEDTPGLRRAQIGAIHAVASHFTLHDDPAVVVMPTGSGKTAVLATTAFMLQAARVLTVTPSRLVRGQISGVWKDLGILKELGVLPDDAMTPAVAEVKNRVASAEAWQALREYDVVVGTPHVVSPAISGVAQPSPDLFDLILVDEAHHSPARIWNALAEAFPTARRVLFTATPFRQDQREIKGRFVYAYPVARAFEDGAFGQVEYVPVDGDDRAIATKAETVLLADRERGLNHLLFVRTDTRTRAEELSVVYEEATDLRLRVVHSGYSLSHVKKSIVALQSGELDGIICVDMLGEGFDLPQLKVAAIHKPHKSLAVTLQFVGRFARVNAPDIGAAKFIAAPADIRIAAERLFKEGAVWQDIIMGLGDDRVRREIALREQLQAFRRVVDLDDVTGDLSLYSLRPYHHVKVLRTHGEVDLTRDISLPRPFAVIHREVNEAARAVVFLTLDRRVPRWTDSDRFARVEYDLFVVYHRPDEGLLFVCSSRRLEPLYVEIADQVCVGGAMQLPLNLLNRALRPFEGIEFYSVGMRNRVRTNNTESYRIMTGASADRAIRPTDGRLFHQGHCFGGADTGAGVETIGISSSSKIWSNKYSQIPDLIAWCDSLAAQITDPAKVLTRSGLDHLPAGERTDRYPGVAIAAEHHEHVYITGASLEAVFDTGEVLESDLRTLNVEVEPNEPGAEVVTVSLRAPSSQVSVKLRIDGAHELVPPVIEAFALVADVRIPLVEYLRDFPPMVYLGDFSAVQGDELLPHSSSSRLIVEQIQARDWPAEGVNIQAEFGPPTEQGTSIHDYLKQMLPTTGAQLVFYDHSTGEAADFIVVTETPSRITFTLLHCKKSRAANPGARVGDAYDISGQVIKSVRWVEAPEALLAHVERRARTVATTEFVVGDVGILEGLVERSREMPSEFRIALVQPGISEAAMSQPIRDVLNAATDHVRASGAEIELWISE